MSNLTLHRNEPTFSDSFPLTSTKYVIRTTRHTSQRLPTFRSGSTPTSPSETSSTTFSTRRRWDVALWRTATMSTHTGGRFTRDARTVTSRMTSSARWRLSRRTWSELFNFMQLRVNDCVWLSWLSCRFRHQKSMVPIQSSANFILLIYCQIFWKDNNKERGRKWPILTSCNYSNVGNVLKAQPTIGIYRTFHAIRLRMHPSMVTSVMELFSRRKWRVISAQESICCVCKISK